MHFGTKNYLKNNHYHIAKQRRQKPVALEKQEAENKGEREQSRAFFLRVADRKR